MARLTTLAVLVPGTLALINYGNHHDENNKHIQQKFDLSHQEEKKLNDVKKIAKFLIIKESEGIKNSIKEQDFTKETGQIQKRMKQNIGNKNILLKQKTQQTAEIKARHT